MEVRDSCKGRGGSCCYPGRAHTLASYDKGKILVLELGDELIHGISAVSYVGKLDAFISRLRDLIRNILHPVLKVLVILQGNGFVRTVRSKPVKRSHGPYCRVKGF